MSNNNLSLLLGELKKILQTEEMDPDVPVGQLGIDSLNVIELILACQQIYGGVVDFENIDISENTTVRDIDVSMSS